MATRVAPKLSVAHAGAPKPLEVEWLPTLVLWRECSVLIAAALHSPPAAFQPTGAWRQGVHWGAGLSTGAPGIFFSLYKAFKDAGLSLRVLAHLV